MSVCEHLRMDGEKNTALRGAAKEGHTECVKNLMENGADVNKSICEEYQKCFAYSCTDKNGHGKFVETLIQAGADVNKCDSFSCQQLLGCSTYNAQCLDLLIKEGADVNTTFYKGQTLLMFCAERGNSCSLKLLIAAGADLEATDERGDTVLRKAAENRRPECVAALIEAGVNVNAVDRWNATALLHTTFGCGGNPNTDDVAQCVSLLIEAGADVNQINYFRNTALQFAAEYNLPDCVRLLINAGASVNESVAESWEFSHIVEGELALSRAAREGHLECVSLLVDGGADVNIRDENGCTPLIACLTGAQGGLKNCQLSCQPRLDKRHDYIECIKILLNARADVNEMNEYGCTALTIAVESGFEDCVDVLMKGKVDLNKKYTNGASLLMYAAGNCFTRFVDFLVDKGADVNATNKSGSTPLICAAKLGWDVCVEKLISLGADVNRSTKTGVTALDAASARCSNNKLKCAQMLLKAGAHIDGNFKSYIRSEVMKDMLCAAGASTKSGVPKNVDKKLDLKNICRETIRCHLMSLNPVNLFYKVDQLKSTLSLPTSLCSFLLYDMSLDVEYKHPIISFVYGSSRSGLTHNSELEDE